MSVQVHSRRSFIKQTGIAMAATAGFTIASCASAEEANEPTKVDEIAWDGEYDVIVAGAGAAGMVAALTVATEGNGATCLLLEKGETPGGNTPYALGMQMYTEHPDELKVYIDALIGDATPEDVIDAYVQGCTESLGWIKSLGATDEELKVGTYSPDPEKIGEWPELPNDDRSTSFGFNGEGRWSHIFSFLSDCVTEHADAIDYKTSTPLEALVQDASNTIVGVRAGGAYYKANKGVIMCTGGFESDPELLFTHTGVMGVKPIAGALNTGDGHRACAKAGAAMWHMHGGAQFWLACRNLENTRHIDPTWNYTNKNWGITVGMNGRRFYQDFDGCGVYGNFAGIEANFAEPDSNLSCNVGYRHGITQWGGEWTHLPMPSKAWFICDAEGLANGGMKEGISDDVVADGWAYGADTIEELAEQIGVPGDELARTVEIWNRYCDQGFDEAFYRPVESLVKVATPPFYAMLCAPAVLNTDGGPVRDAKARILDPFGNPIPHLYSAGEFGSIWGHFYVGSGNIAECHVFGRIAARSALAGE